MIFSKNILYLFYHQRLFMAFSSSQNGASGFRMFWRATGAVNPTNANVKMSVLVVCAHVTSGRSSFNVSRCVQYPGLDQSQSWVGIFGLKSDAAAAFLFNEASGARSGIRL
jgi:hypothetical protein